MIMIDLQRILVNHVVSFPQARMLCIKSQVFNRQQEEAGGVSRKSATKLKREIRTAI